MGLNRHYPLPTQRMGILLTLHGVRDCAVIEYGPMGTANYYDWSASNYGIAPMGAHFAVHTTEMDISLGQEGKLLDAIAAVERDYQPKIIFVLASAIMNVIGADVEGILAEAAASVRTPVMTFPETGGDYMSGMQLAMENLTALVPEHSEPEPFAYGILGALPDDFHFQSDVQELKIMMRRYFGAQCLCTFPYACSTGKIAGLRKTQVNLVMRQEALSAAQLLMEKCGTPYLYMRPYGRKATEEALAALSELTGWQLQPQALEDRDQTEMKLEAYRKDLRFYHGSHLEKAVLLSGNYDTVKGISAFLRDELSLAVYPRARASFRKDLPIYEDAQWSELVKEHPQAVIFGSGEDRIRFGERAGVVSPPAVRYHDFTQDRPFIGYRGALNLVQLFDDCRPLG